MSRGTLNAGERGGCCRSPAWGWRIVHRGARPGPPHPSGMRLRALSHRARHPKMLGSHKGTLEEGRGLSVWGALWGKLEN